MMQTETKPINVKFVRKDIGGGFCLHLDAANGLFGLSRREDLNAKPANPDMPDVWLDEIKCVALYRAIEVVVEGKNLIPGQMPTPKAPPISSSNSPFFQANVKTILAHKVGMMKKAPFLLRWLYSAVVTKDVQSRH